MPELIVGEYGKALVRCEKYHATHGIETCVARYKKWHDRRHVANREDFKTCGQCEFISELLKTRRDKCPYCGKDKWDWEPHCASNKCRSMYRVRNVMNGISKDKKAISTLNADAEGEMSIVETVKVSENKKSEAQEKQEVRCQICGAPFTPYKNGAVTISSVCRSCRRKRIREGLERSREYQHLTLVFPDIYRDVYEWVMDKAHEELRTPAMQIIWILKSVMEQQIGKEVVV